MDLSVYINLQSHTAGLSVVPFKQCLATVQCGGVLWLVRDYLAQLKSIK